jgi:hypothetical protein
LASPVELRLRVGPRALRKKKIREQGVKITVLLSVRNAPKGNQLGVNK